MMSLRQRVIKGISWSFVNAVISRGVLLLTSIVLAHLLVKEEYGLIGIVKSTIGIFALVAGGGLGIASTKYVAELKLIDKKKIGRILSFSSLFTLFAGISMCLLLIVFSDYIALYQFNDLRLSSLLKYGAVIIFFESINGYQLGAISGFEAFKQQAIASIIVSFFHFIALIGGTLLFGIDGCMLGYIISRLINWAINNYFISKLRKIYDIRLSYRDCYKEFGSFLQLGLPSLINSLVVMTSIWLSNSMLVNSANGMSEMGTFSACSQLREVALFIPATVSTVVLPILSSLVGESNRNNYGKVLKYNIAFNFVIVLLIIIPICLFSEFIMGIFGEGYKSGYLCLVFLMVSCVFVALNNIVAQVIVSKSKMWYGFIFNSIWASIFLLLTHFTCENNMGALGVAIAYACSYLIHLIIQSIYALISLRNDKTV